MKAWEKREPMTQQTKTTTDKYSVALPPPNLQWRDGILHAPDYSDYYFSSDDGLAETRYNFIEHNFLAERFAALRDGEVFRIAETGFGSGLNFLATWQLWNDVAPKGAMLEFTSFELHPMLLAELATVHQHFSEVADLGELLRAHYPPRLPGWHRVQLSESVSLSLWFGEANKGLLECDHSQMGAFDAWFLDGFAPVSNPEMWQPSLFQHMARLSHANTTYATFTVAAVVRKGLQAVGFSFNKDSGFGLKREMCFGRYEQPRPHHHKAPWFARTVTQKTPTKVAVIGAGLAGAACAARLAQAGVQVSVFDAESDVATQASGNLAGTLHPLLTTDWNVRSRWYWAGMAQSLQWLQSRVNSGEVTGELNGIVQLAGGEKSQKVFDDSFMRVQLPQDFAQALSPEQASEKLGVETGLSGVWYPQGGWVHPKSAVQALLDDSNICVHYQHALQSLERVGDAWQLGFATENGQVVETFSDVVIATGSLADDLNQQLGLPIRPVKGQVSHLQAQEVAQPLKCAVTHSGYSAPAANGFFVAGATFEAPDMSTELSVAGHETNLAHSRSALRNWLVNDVATESLQGRIAFRPTTPDHLPIVGAVPDWQWLEENYCQQSHTHAVYRYPPLQTQKGLYVSNGHGARGLASVFLAAEIIHAEMFHRALPLAQSLYHASHPARFVVRQWRSGKWQSSNI